MLNWQYYALFLLSRLVIYLGLCEILTRKIFDINSENLYAQILKNNKFNKKN